MRLILLFYFALPLWCHAIPLDNPVASHTTPDVGYPAWTDRIRWDRVRDMSQYGSAGQSDFEKFEAARDEVHALGGGVLYYPAGVYDFSDAPMDGKDGRGLMLKSGVVIRGEAPTVDADASDGSLSLGTRFDFGFTSRTGTGVTPTGETPRDWNFIGLQPDSGSGETLSEVENVGIVYVHLVGATIFWGFELDWGGSTPYASSGAWKAGLVKSGWADRVADGQFPLDYFAGSSGSRNYVGAGSGRLVFGCILQDAAPVNNVYREGRSDPKNFGDSGYGLQKFGARIQVYGSKVCIANNLLPQSTRGFLYQQTVGHNPNQSTDSSQWINQTQTLFFNYNYCTGIDVNKELLNPYGNKYAGYVQPYILVRDNWVYNHGRKGFNLSGAWGEIRNNTNDRDYLGSTVPPGSGPASGQNYYLTLDGYVQVKPGGSGDISDTLSRAFDLAGGPLWIDDNTYGGVYGSTGSIGNDGEGILCQAHGGTQLVSWAVTYNYGQDGYMAGYDVTHSGSLFGWNTTTGSTGNIKAGSMNDSAIVNNSGGFTSITDAKALTSNPGNPTSAPTGVTSSIVEDRVEIRWTDTSAKETGYRVERSVDSGPWTVIAYRPRQNGEGGSSNPAAWHDHSAPRGRSLQYRVRPTNWTDNGTVVSAATASVTLPTLSSTGTVVDPETLIPQDPQWESGYQSRVSDLVNAKSWSIGSGNGDADIGKRDWPGLLGQMWKVRNNNSSLQSYINSQGMTLVNSSEAGRFYKAFSVPGYNMFYFTFKDYNPSVGLSTSQENQARNINQWSYLTREDNRMDPIYGQTEFNSENFNWMARLGGLQWAFELPNTDLGTYQYNWQAGQAKGMSRDYFPAYMDNWTRALFHTGRVEWNSVNYWGYTFHPILTLLEHPPADPSDSGYQEKVRKQTRAGADWMVLEIALHYLDGFTGGADTRAKTKPHVPFAGSAWPSAYLYFAEDGHMPSYDVATAKSKMSRNLVGWFPWSSYRPLNVIKSIAQRDFSLPVEIQSAKPFYHLDHDNYASWQGDGSYAQWKAAKSTEEQAHRTGFRYEFETIYMDTNYLLSTAATYRPNGSVGTFSEQNLFRLLVTGTNAGALQVIGNTGYSSGNPAGRDPYEQIGQYGNVAMRVTRHPTSSSNSLWYAVPVSATRIMEGKRLFVDMGNGVYVAVLPLGSPTTRNNLYNDGQSAHQQYHWDYASGQLAAVVFEVGTLADHGNFASFRSAFSSRNVTSPGGSRVEYTATDGKTLRMEWTGVVHDYPMTENGGYTLGTGGVIPRTWRDGTEVDYESWNTYEVVQGERIVHQEWGRGRLWMSAAGESVEISVDPVTSDVRYTVGAPEPGTGQRAPQVAAGPDDEVLPGSLYTLAGSATDDGLPDPPAALTYQWSMVEGPGTPHFGDATSPTSTVRLPVVGAYLLRLTVSDGEASASDTLWLTAVSSPSRLTATESGTGEVVLSWPDAAAETGYRIRLSRDGGSSWTVVSNVVTSNTTQFTVTGLIPEQAYLFEVCAKDGGTARPGTTASLTTSAPLPGYVQSASSPHLVVVEAENYSSKATNGSSDSWTATTAYSGYRGTGLMTAGPDDMEVYLSNVASSAPVLNFDILFNQTGTHYLFIRCREAPQNGQNGDSLHAGINGVMPATAELIEKPLTSSGIEASFVWASRLRDNTRVSLEVPSVGRHTVNIWPREDGIIVDTILLTTDVTYTPAGNESESTLLSGVQTLSPIETWRQTHFGTAMNSGDAADARILTGDSMPNLMKFAMGATPWTSAAGLHPTHALKEGHLEYSYRRREGSGSGTTETGYSVDGVSYTLQTSGSLLPPSWQTGTDVWEERSVQSNGDGTETVTVRRRNVPAGSTSFMRLHLE